MEEEMPLTPAVSFEGRMENRPVGSDELDLIAALPPELPKEMLLHEGTEGA